MFRRLVLAAAVVASAGALAGGADAPDVDAALEQRLLRACANSLAKDPAAAVVRQAEGVLAGMRTGRGSEYLEACRTIRQHRPRSAVPMLLVYMLKHADASSHRIVQEYADTLTILTGEEVSCPEATVAPSQRPAAVRKAVAQAAGVLLPLLEAGRLSTSLATMTPPQLRRVIAVLASRTSRGNLWFGPPSRGGADSAGHIASVLTDASRKLGTDSRSSLLTSGDLSGVMVPYLLERTGYRPATQPAAAGGPDAAASPAKMDYAVIPLLAQLRKDGQAKELDRISADPRQPASVRLTCLLAMRAAGEAIPAGALLPIVDNERTGEVLLAAVIALQYVADDSAAGKIVALLDHADAAVVEAACVAAAELKPPQAVAKLGKVLAGQDDRLALLAIMALGKYKSRPAADALVVYMQAAMKEGEQKRSMLYRAYDAFGDTTGYPYRPAGAAVSRDIRLLHQEVNKAIRWYRSAGRRP